EEMEERYRDDAADEEAEDDTPPARALECFADFGRDVFVMVFVEPPVEPDPWEQRERHADQTEPDTQIALVGHGDGAVGVTLARTKNPDAARTKPTIADCAAALIGNQIAASDTAATISAPNSAGSCFRSPAKAGAQRQTRTRGGRAR